MFKIVETVGRCGKQLTIIPFAWEKNGELFWPKTGADKLVLVADSKPDFSWFCMSCKVRGNLFADFPMERDEIEKMLKQHETARLNLNQSEESTVDLTEDYSMTAVKREFESPNQVSESFESPNQASESFESPNQASESFESPNQVSGEMAESTNQAPGVDSNEKRPNKSMEEKLDQILANQRLLIQKQNDFQERLKIFEDLFNVDNTEQPEETEEQTMINPIDSYEELVALEEKLSDKNTSNEYVQKLSYICGKNGNGNGSDNCYLLVDRLFTRKFMTLCSWAGGARDKKEKIPFKLYKNVINVFFRIVRLSDKDFTLEHCENFFKGVIRNSTRRNESHRIRTSRSKRRPKNLSYRIKEGLGEEHDVNVELNFFKDEHDECSDEEEIPEKQSKFQ